MPWESNINNVIDLLWMRSPIYPPIHSTKSYQLPLCSGHWEGHQTTEHEADTAHPSRSSLSSKEDI